jgi:enoyl-CoA hydratase/carnithine racemase
LEIGASCDFRLAADGASFALPELPNLGVIPGSGGISRVTRLIGPHWGKWLAFGQEVSAELALTMGLVHAVYPAASFRERVTAFARELAALPTEAAGVTKIAVDIAASVDRGTARDFDRYANTVLLTSDEHQSMVEAFRNRKRAAGGGATRDQAE